MTTNPEDQEDSAKAGTFERSGPTGMSGAQLKASIVAALLLFVAGLFTLRDFLPALAWAAIFAIGLWPLLDRLSARWPRHRRMVLPALLTLATLLVFVIPVTMVAVPLINDAHAASEWLAQARQSGIPAPPALTDLPFGARLTALWQANIGQPGSISALAAKGAHGGFANIGRHAAEQVLHRLTLLGFMLVTLFFLLRDGEDFAQELRIGSQRAFGQAGEDLGEQIVRSIRGTINGLVLVGLAEGVILGVVYAITGVPHAALFGIATALLAMVPFGAPVAFLIAAAALLLTGNALGAGAIVAVGAVVTFIADHFFRPVLIGGATRLPFLWVLLGILGGFEAWGLVGLFVGPAIMAALVQLWSEWVGSRRGPINPPAIAESGAPEE